MGKFAEFKSNIKEKKTLNDQRLIILAFCNFSIYFIYNNIRTIL